MYYGQLKTKNCINPTFDPARRALYDASSRNRTSGTERDFDLKTTTRSSPRHPEPDTTARHLPPGAESRRGKLADALL
jgi:hypothetical protein